MHTLDVIKERRSIKHYDPDFEIPEKDIACLLEHMLESPTSFNLQHWKIVNVSDSQLREKIRDAAWGQEQVTDASLLFVLCANMNAWQDHVDTSWKDAPVETQTLMKSMINDFYDGNSQLQRDEALRSVGIIAQTAMLTAKALGYDSCPMIGFDAQKVSELINLPSGYLVGMMLVVGKPTQAARPKPGQLSLNEVLVANQFA